jgi:ribosomal protein L16 Arg81 hydroxylase
MTMSKPGLCALFNLSNPCEFLDSCWPDKLHLARGPVTRLAGLVDYDVDEIIAMRKHHTRANFRTLEGKSRQMSVEPGHEKALYDAGFTLYFHSLSSPGTNEWIAALDQELGLVPGATRVSAFASRRGRGLKAHYDQNDNFICQAAGQKRWRIAPNTHVKHPTVGYAVGNPPTPQQAAEAPNGFPTELPTPFETVDMEPGAVMFVPRGMWHDTETLDGASLHFNIQCGVATWKDVIEFLLVGTTALQAETLREPLLGLLHDRARGAELQAGLKEKLRTLVELLCAEEIEIDRERLQRYVARRRNA